MSASGGQPAKINPPSCSSHQALKHGNPPTADIFFGRHFRAFGCCQMAPQNGPKEVAEDRLLFGWIVDLAFWSNLNSFPQTNQKVSCTFWGSGATATSTDHLRAKFLCHLIDLSLFDPYSLLLMLRWQSGSSRLTNPVEVHQDLRFARERLGVNQLEGTPPLVFGGPFRGLEILPWIPEMSLSLKLTGANVCLKGLLK